MAGAGYALLPLAGYAILGSLLLLAAPVRADLPGALDADRCLEETKRYATGFKYVRWKNLCDKNLMIFYDNGLRITAEYANANGAHLGTSASSGADSPWPRLVGACVYDRRIPCKHGKW